VEGHDLSELTEIAGGLTLYHVYVDVNGKVLPATTQI